MADDPNPNRDRDGLARSQRWSREEVEAAGEAQARSRNVGNTAGGISRRGRIRVLVVDDHAIVRQGLATMLRQSPDIEVVYLGASDGSAALDIARREHPDVVVMDVNMTGMDGIEATRQICEEMPGVHVIGLSMDTNAASAVMAAGADRFLCKECCGSDLLAAIRQCMAVTSGR